jgi:hypothetical protein
MTEQDASPSHGIRCIHVKSEEPDHYKLVDEVLARNIEGSRMFPMGGKCPTHGRHLTLAASPSSRRLLVGVWKSWSTKFCERPQLGVGVGER